MPFWPMSWRLESTVASDMMMKKIGTENSKNFNLLDSNWLPCR